MSSLSDYAKKNCTFAGISGVRSVSDGKIVISIQTKGERNSFARKSATKKEEK